MIHSEKQKDNLNSNYDQFVEICLETADILLDTKPAKFTLKMLELLFVKWKLSLKTIFTVYISLKDEKIGFLIF